MNKFVALGIFLCLAFLGNAQNGKIINKEFDIEAFNKIEFNLYGDVVYEKWEADYILVETTVKVWDTPKKVFLSYVNRGRYFCDLQASNTTAKINSVKVPRPKLTVEESVVSVIYYPTDFEPNVDNQLVKVAASAELGNEEEEEK